MFNESNVAFADEDTMSTNIDKAEKLVSRFAGMTFFEAAKLNATDREELLNEIPFADRDFVARMIELCTC